MKKIIYLTLFFILIGCSKSQRLSNDFLIGKWSDLINGEIRYGGSSGSDHYHVNSNGTINFYHPNSTTELHTNEGLINYTLEGNKIIFTYPSEDDTDGGDVEVLDDNNIKIIGKPDISDPSHIPTVYWRRTND